jgi:hypothetical protein
VSYKHMDKCDMAWMFVFHSGCWAILGVNIFGLSGAVAGCIIGCLIAIYRLRRR